jgi:hypothetical protein
MLKEIKLTEKEIKKLLIILNNHYKEHNNKDALRLYTVIHFQI